MRALLHARTVDGLSACHDRSVIDYQQRWPRSVIEFNELATLPPPPPRPVDAGLLRRVVCSSNSW